MCVRGSDEDNYPQYASVRAGTSDYNADIKSEKTFEQFITAKDSSDYDSEADMYRWKTVIGISELTAHFNSLIGSYLRKNGSVYILENGEPSDKVVNDIGNIASLVIIVFGEHLSAFIERHLSAFSIDITIINAIFSNRLFLVPTLLQYSSL